MHVEMWNESGSHVKSRPPSTCTRMHVHRCPELANVPAPKVHTPWQLSQKEQSDYKVSRGEEVVVE